MGNDPLNTLPTTIYDFPRVYWDPRDNNGGNGYKNKQNRKEEGNITPSSVHLSKYWVV